MTNACDMPHCRRAPVAYYRSINGKRIEKNLCKVHLKKLLIEHWGREAVGGQTKESSPGRSTG